MWMYCTLLEYKPILETGKICSHNYVLCLNYILQNNKKPTDIGTMALTCYIFHITATGSFIISAQ